VKLSYFDVLTFATCFLSFFNQRLDISGHPRFVCTVTTNGSHRYGFIKHFNDRVKDRDLVILITFRVCMPSPVFEIYFQTQDIISSLVSFFKNHQNLVIRASNGRSVVQIRHACKYLIKNVFTSRRRLDLFAYIKTAVVQFVKVTSLECAGRRALS
jgi:hypothetical protein